jgi:2,3-bisphosphoglycerate-dependent phosphoglycerate mutase/probable phosphoglycerate mutase
VHDVLIIRHGESEWNRERRWQGWLDAPLTERGVRQAHERARLLARSGFEPRLVHCSDLVRAHRTAQIVAAALDVTCRTDAGFRERSGGEWEGSTGDEIDRRWPGQREAFRRGELATPPGGEADGDVLVRFDAALSNAIAHGVPTVVVTHHGVLRLVATRAGMPVEALIPNLGGYWFALDGTTLTDPEPIAALAVEPDIPFTE